MPKNFVENYFMKLNGLSKTKVGKNDVVFSDNLTVQTKIFVI